MDYIPYSYITHPSIFCDSTVFSDIDFSISNIHSSMDSEAKVSKPSHATFPALPTAHNLSALANPTRFGAYIASEIPEALNTKDNTALPPATISQSSAAATTAPDKFRKSGVNSTFLHTLLKSPPHSSKIEHEWIKEVVFPDDKLPIPFNSAEVKKCALLWDPATSTIPNLPDNLYEDTVRHWLNFLVSTLAVVHKIESGAPPNGADRGFDSSSATRPVAGSYAGLKPDICLLDRQDMHNDSQIQEGQMHWRNIYAFIEITSSTSSPLNNLLAQVTAKAACLFDVQPQRKFVCTICLFPKPTDPSILQYTFVIIDRSGLIRTTESPFKNYSLIHFLRVIFAFAFANTAAIGWDSSMTVDPTTKNVTSIAVTNRSNPNSPPTSRKFTVVKLIHSSPILYGRGTRVWIVKDTQPTGNTFYVLKDSWILLEHTTSEIQFLDDIGTAIKDDKDGYLFTYSCPLYAIGEDCVWSTGAIRDMPDSASHIRNRRRIVTATIGDPITSFRSKKEFVSVFLDLVNALQFLHDTVHVVHGDLSINNVLINRVWHYKAGKSPTDLQQIASSRLASKSTKDIQIPPSTITTPGTSCNSADSALQFPTTPVGCKGTVEPIESAGMLIDCDFMRYTYESRNLTSGTLPFMSIESLVPFSVTRNDFRHSSQHDLECLLNTILTVCHYTTGPNGKLRIALPGDERIKFNEWFTTADRLTLAATKSITLEAFNTFIAPALPDYWKDFTPFLYRLVQATWDAMPFLEAPNVATYQAYRTILLDALKFYNDEPLSPYAFVTSAKRPSDGGGSASKRQCVKNSRPPTRTRKMHTYQSFVESHLTTSKRSGGSNALNDTTPEEPEE